MNRRAHLKGFVAASRSAMVLVIAGSLAGCASMFPSTSPKIAEGYALPADQDLTIILMRPDVDVSEMQLGGVAKPNAEWTANARTHLTVAVKEHHRRNNISVTLIPEEDGANAKLAADYRALFETVAGAIITHKYDGQELPTKKNKFDWTLGQGMQTIGDLAQGNYALFLYARDSFASGERQAAQVVGLLGCVVGFCSFIEAGQHIGFAALVEVKSGQIVWFNILQGSKGDVRTPTGAQKMVDSILWSMPKRVGDARKGQVQNDPERRQ